MRIHSLVFIFLLGSVACSISRSQVELSPATEFDAVGIVDVQAKVPDIALEIRYASTNNFVGTRIDGYEAPKCFLLEPVAAALARVEASLRNEQLRLKLFDCYRPTRAVAHFVRWAQDLDAQQMKAQFYPGLDKSQLLGEYIAPVSGHSRAATLDLTLVSCDSAQTCEELDMGTPFDFFDERAHTDFQQLTQAQRNNRDRLREAMRVEGFENYPAEWWHFTFKPEPSPTLAYDIPIR